MTDQIKRRVGCPSCGYELLWTRGETVCFRGTSLFYHGDHHAFAGNCKNCGKAFRFDCKTGNLVESLDTNRQPVLT